jgi:cell division protein FtsW
MAWGRGNWAGEGLGNSLQKLEFLPEAHTDFIMSIVAEELGFVGVVLVLCLVLVIVVKSLKLGNKALQQERAYEGFMAYAIGIWFSFQTAVNVGASSGVLPTKGLTLPLVSSGGSSLIVMLVAVGILLRIDFELKTVNMHALSKGSGNKPVDVKQTKNTGKKAKARRTRTMKSDLEPEDIVRPKKRRSKGASHDD